MAAGSNLPVQSRGGEVQRRVHLDPDATYLTFCIGQEVFAINVFQVREVLDLLPITKVPNTPDFMLGMIDVRGHSVPVIDLRRKFGLPPADMTADSRIMVVEVVSGGQYLVVGALTDRVYEVTALDSAEADPPPEVGVRWNSEAIKGIGRRKDRFVIVLDLDRVFSSAELPMIAGA